MRAEYARGLAYRAFKTAGSGGPIGSDTVEYQQEGANMADREWDGKTVSVQRKGLEGLFSNKPIRVEFTEQAARTVALALARLKQTTMVLPGEAQELLTALDYVMVGDPASTRAHNELEAGKGMTPDGGYKAPENLGRLKRGRGGRLEQEAREGAETMERPY